MAFQKRPTDFIDPLASKKPRISHFTQRAQPTLNGKLGAPNGHETLLPAPGPTPSDTLSLRKVRQQGKTKMGCWSWGGFLVLVVLGTVT